jgi:hypothetical protein
MLSYTDLSSEEFLSKGIKKSYQAMLIPEIKQMIKTIDELNETIQKMSQKEEELQHEIEVRDAQLNTPEHEVALAIKKMMQSTAETIVDSKTPSIVREQVTKHMEVSVETEAVYDPYDGCHFPHYASNAEVSWK